jgi:DHA3 family macrolide efflux protein-like MFS transporter
MDRPPELDIRSRWLSGMRGFTVVWLGQFVSLLGTGMTGFALTIWAWQTTGSATALALVGLFQFAPTVLMSPIAGALVDRWNRKLVMMLSDLAAGLSTVVVLILMATGRLEIWHLYVTGAFSGLFQSFQFPAYSAAVTMMLQKEQYARANGMIGLAGSASNIMAPVAAGIFLGYIGTTGIMAFDIVTFMVAIGALLLVHIPQPPSKGPGQGERPSLLKDSVFGFRYIYERPSLLGLQLVFFSINLIISLSFPLLAPMILSRTNNDTLILGSVQSAFGVGGVVGGVLMSVWGGPKRRVHGVLMGMAASSLLGVLMIGLSRGPLIWAFGAFANMCFISFVNGSNQAIWQAKVPPEVQGRVFATRRLIAQITAPIGMALAGPLADWIFGPAMMPGGALAPTFGWLVGTGPGTGISLIFVIAGLIGATVGLSGYAFNSVRNVEDILPDHDAAVKSAEIPS